MPAVQNLEERIKAEISGHKQRVSQYRTTQVEEHKGRQQRLERLEEIFEQLRDVWKPRLDALAAQFKDSVKVTPTVKPGRRQATLEFQSPLARIVLRLSASADSDVNNVVLAYDLDILPIYAAFERHAEIAFPINDVDAEATTRWLDDRIVAFVKVYLSLYENEYYLKDHMVEDPVARIRFPKFAAAASIQRDGKTYYFISDETRTEFERQAK
jgi:YHS domain-containing protein